jgi:hypothetical protein
MSWRSDDLASVLGGGGGGPVGRTQGIIQSFNPDTFENVVAFGGAQHQNLVVTNPVDALGYQPGDVVIVESWAPSGRGLASYAIAGRWLVPAGGRAAEAVGFLQTTVAKAIVDELVAQLLTSPAGVELAQFVNSQLIQIAVDAGQTTTSSTTFGDGSAAGPQVTGVQVSATGRCLVLWGASADVGPRTDGGQIGGNMSVAISGATTVAADITRTYQVSQSVTVTGASWSHRIGGRALTGHLFTGLNAGTHTISGKYASGVSGQSVAFANRLIIAIAY